MKNQNVVIRPFDAATDIRKLSGIWLDASLVAHPFIGERRLIEQWQLIEEKYLPNAETWVACRMGEPLASSACWTRSSGRFLLPQSC
jgi:hypothetical protein